MPLVPTVFFPCLGKNILDALNIAYEEEIVTITENVLNLTWQREYQRNRYCIFILQSVNI